MKKLTQKKGTRKALSNAEIAQRLARFEPMPIAARTLAEQIQAGIAGIDPAFTKLTEELDIYEIMAALKARKPKRAPGRPGITDKWAVLDAAAREKARTGSYSQLASHWNLSVEQIRDLVRHHRSYFNRKVKEASK